MRTPARTAIGIAVMLAVAAPALRQVPGAAAQSAHAVTHHLTALQFPDEERPYVPTRAARWEGCEPIPVLTNVPDPMLEDVRQALATLSDAAGREIHIAGHTTRTPTTRWPIDGQRLDPHDPHPAVIIAVAHHRETDLLTRSRRGAAIANPSQGRYVTGAVVISDRTLERWPAGSTDLQRLLLHELGHLAGLDHAREGTIMHAHVHEGGPTTYTPDDLAGIAAMFHCDAETSAAIGP